MEENLGEIQVPSTRINQFLNDPRGGETLSKYLKVLLPTIDLLEFLYPHTNGYENLNVEAGETISLPITDGAGLYRVRIVLAGFIVANLATEGSIFLTSSETGRLGIQLLNVSLAAAQIYNLPSTVIEQYVTVLSDDAVGKFNVETVYTSAPTKVEFTLSYDIIRVV